MTKPFSIYHTICVNERSNERKNKLHSLYRRNILFIYLFIYSIQITGIIYRDKYIYYRYRYGIVPVFKHLLNEYFSQKIDNVMYIFGMTT